MHVRNPATGEVDFDFEPPSSDALAELCARLRAGQPTWERAGVDGRATAMMAWRDALIARRAGVVDALVHDTGRRVESELEVDAILGSLERWCRQAPTLLAAEPAKPASIPFINVVQDLRPYPLVAVISPWNFPLLLSLIDAIPALLAGCAVVIKPSEVTPRFIAPIVDSIAAVPALASVLAYVAGAGETGATLIDDVDAVCFTGSVPTGMKVGEHAARRFIPAFLELGGKDPAVVLASADLDHASSAILWGGTANAGQSCLSIERIYVDATIFEPFVELLVEKARNLRFVPQGGELGPIIADKQVAVIAEHLADAHERGAKARTGGALEHIAGGTYCPATVFTDVNHTMKVMTEETFGPILPVMAVDGIDAAVEHANDSIYGLSAAIFAGTADEALAVAPRMRAGAVSINDAALTALIHDGEKNSFNRSGMGGSRMGPAALRRFARRQAYLINTVSTPDPWWYPHLHQKG